MTRRLFRAAGPDRVSVRLPEGLGELLHLLTEELRSALLADDADEVRRLYPTAYPDDPDRNRAFDEQVHDRLLLARLDAIDRVQSTIDSDVIDVDTADAWMSTLNQMRLVLGERLDVGEEDPPLALDDADDPDMASHVVYGVLTELLGDLTDARAALL